MRKQIKNGSSSLLLLLLIFPCFVFAQTITGKVNDNKGTTVPFANVIQKGTTNGTTTDMDGNFSIDVESLPTVLVFSSLGYTTVEQNVTSAGPVSVTMAESAEALSEVVVTALGISREKKSLGYATQEVKGEAISTVKSQNFVNSLSGKVAGLDIKSSGTLGGSTNVVIRGSSSIAGNNQALFVIDGIPVNNSTNNSKDQTTGRGGYDYGNAASDINPDDIASINVLKGAAASALYGSRASNGVIMITTKKGKQRKGVGVTLNSSLMVGYADISTLPRYQTKYGAGYGPYYGTNEDGYFNDFEDINGDGVADLTVPFTEDASWGGEFNPSQNIYQWTSIYPQLSTFGQATPWVAAENNPNYVWGASTTAINSVSIDGGSDTSSFRLGYTNMLQEGNLPNSSIKRNSINFNGSQELSDKFTVSTSFTFTKTDGQGRYGTGYDSNNVMQQFRQWFQTNVDVKQQRDAYFATRENITWNTQSGTDLRPIYSDNPYWTFYENYETDTRKRYYGNAVLNYELNDWLSLMGRFAFDTFSELQEERTNVGSANVSQYKRINNNVSEYNYDLFLNFKKDLSEKLNLDGNIGFNLRRNEWSRFEAATNGGLNLPGVYTLDNSASPLGADNLTEYEAVQMVDGLFGRVSLGYDNFAFVEGTYRTDRDSSLPIDNNRFNYWSATGSLVFSNLIDANWLSFGKVRANYGVVGNGTDPYQVFTTYTIQSPFGGVGSASNSPSLKNLNLLPEEQENWEVGLEMQFAKKRLGFDVTYYDALNINQITDVPVSNATGYTSVLLNAGTISNKGWEVQLNATPLKTDNFSWDLSLNWSKNESLVVELTDGIENLQLGSFQGGVSINATPGEPYGTIRGRDYVYHENGQRIVGANGRYLLSDESNVVIGDINPDWNAGLNNSFNYKNFNLSFLLDMQKGGEVFSLDTYYGFGTGLYDFTAADNELGNPLRDPVADGGGILFEGVNEDGTPNTTRAEMTGAGRFGYNQPNAAHVYDAGFIKLREASLTYNLGERALAQLPFNTVSFSVIGKNLWIIDKSVPYADPEAGLSAGNIQGNQSGSYPSIREIGASLKLQF